MTLLKLDIHAVRNIHKENVDLDPVINFFYGENGSGKSAIIEAIFILGRAKSFRTSNIKSVINFDHNNLIVSAQSLQLSGANLHLGVQLDGKGFTFRINQQTTQKRSELAYALPLQIIHPKSFELLDAGPQLRREFLDWGVFNDNTKFISIWQKYKKALLQRNSLLKSKQTAYINVWDKELVNYGTIVNDYRQHYLYNFKSAFDDILEKFLDIKNIDIKLISGWNSSTDLQNSLDEDFYKDLRYGFTHSGPHRGDLHLLINNKPAKDFVSRGQLKLLVISLKLAQMHLLSNKKSNMGCFLIDDFSAELDIANRSKLLDFLSKINCQVFITATSKSEFGDLRNLKSYKMFHVEHGNIKQV